MHSHADAVTGRLLEIRDRDWSKRYGHDIVLSDVLDIDPSNVNATIIADLQDDDVLKPESYDCIICTQTLQYMADPKHVLGALFTALAPGGTMLVTVPGLQQIDHHLKDIDRWRFLPAGVESMAKEICSGVATFRVKSFGSTIATLGFIAGACKEELPEAKHAYDPFRPLIIGLEIRKWTDS